MSAYILIFHSFNELFIFSSLLCLVAPEDKSPFITVHNKTQIESTIFAAVDHVKMRMRKRKEEEECYRIAREATFSWKTAAVYKKDPVFEDDDDLETQWWQKPELSREKKQEKLRAAEREVKFQMTNKKKLQQPFKSKSFNSFQTSAGGQFRPRLPYTRPDTRRCHGCQNLGHIFRFCPNKSQIHQNQGQQNLQLGYQSKFKPGSANNNKFDGN